MPLFPIVGIPKYSVRSTTLRNLLGHFVTLLTRLADGLEYKAEYDDDDKDDAVTPLEGALTMLETLVESLEVVTEEDAVQNLELDIKTEVCIEYSLTLL